MKYYKVTYSQGKYVIYLRWTLFELKVVCFAPVFVQYHGQQWCNSDSVNQQINLSIVIAFICFSWVFSAKRQYKRHLTRKSNIEGLKKTTCISQTSSILLIAVGLNFAFDNNL